MSLIKKSFPYLIILILFFIGLSIYKSNSSSTDADLAVFKNMPKHKYDRIMGKIESHSEEMGKPRAALRIFSEPIEKTFSGNYILGARFKINDESIDLANYKWKLPPDVTLLSGSTEGVAKNGDTIEIEVALENEDATVDISLAAYYYDNGIKIGNSKTFPINEVIAPEFKNAKAFVQENKKLNQKIFQ